MRALWIGVIGLAFGGVACGDEASPPVATAQWLLRGSGQNFMPHLVDGQDGDEGIGVQCNVSGERFDLSVRQPTTDSNNAGVLRIINGTTGNSCRVEVEETPVGARTAQTYEGSCTTIPQNNGTDSCTLTVTDIGGGSVSGTLTCALLRPANTGTDSETVELVGPGGGPLTFQAQNCD